MARSFSQLDAHARLSNHKGVDVRPMLLRVLTDLYVQEHRPSREREQQFCELVLRLLPAVDVQTRVAVAAKLAQHPHVPSMVLDHLAADVPDVAEALRPASAGTQWDPNAPAADEGATLEGVAPVDTPRQAYLPAQDPLRTTELSVISPALGEAFLAAGSADRQALIAKLDEELGHRGATIARVTKPGSVERLEKAALAADAAEFSRELHRSFDLSRRVGTRIAEDESGEALVIVAHAIGMPRAVLVRVLLFLNARIGQSVERVFALVRLYETMGVGTALRLFASWREAGVARAAAAHQPLHAPDGVPAGAGLMANARRPVDASGEGAVDRRGIASPRDRRQGTT